jgi:hypothetical protein
MTQTSAAEDLCVDIVREVARLTQTDPLDLSPIAEVVDTDALAELLRSAKGDQELVVSFQYEGFEIAAYSCGKFRITEQDNCSHHDERATPAQLTSSAPKSQYTG